MGERVEGGILDNRDLERFTAFSSNVSVKDQIDLMSRNWFSLTVGRTEAIEHEYVDAQSNRTERIRITGSPEHGIATVHDQDLLIFVISQWIEARRQGTVPTRRVCFTPYQFFAWINRTPTGSAYQRLRDALHRLKTTNVETTKHFGAKSRKNIKQFSWVSEWEILEGEDGFIRGIEVVLAEWLFESIQNFHVLTLDKRYFDIDGSVERWLYLYARKATGGPTGIWKESFKSLYRKSASQQEYKHYAATLRKLIKRNRLPDFKLTQSKSSTGLDMLVMERLEKRAAIEQKAEIQMPLIEKSPIEEAWETVLEFMVKRVGEAETTSWIRPLELRGLESGVLTLRCKTQFIADWVENHYRLRLLEAWKALGHDIKTIKLEVRSAGVAA